MNNTGNQQDNDIRFMRQALQEAHKAMERDEVPIGAVIVANNQVIARAHNLTEALTDVTAHAEMQAITSAADFLGAIGKVAIKDKWGMDAKSDIFAEPPPKYPGRG